MGNTCDSRYKLRVVVSLVLQVSFFHLHHGFALKKKNGSAVDLNTISFVLQVWFQILDLGQVISLENQGKL